jgi:hypothetical protein
VISCWTGEDGRVHTTPANMVADRICIKKGIPYRFWDRPFMIPVFDDRHNLIAMKTARQVSKSTTLAANAIIRGEAHAPYTCLIVTPSQDQTRKFSHDRLGPTIETSPAVRARVTAEQLSNVLEREFVDGSKIYMSYARDNADRARGITADELDLDEVQDMVLSLVEPVLRESLFTSRHKRRVWSGTPKSMSNGLEQRVWRQSDQREWMVRCYHHGKLPLHQKLGLENVGLHGPICKRCGNPLNTLDGLWVRTCTRTEQGKEPRIHGYHLPQIIFPTTDIEVHPGVYGFLDWAQFKEDLDAEDEATVLNEKFGESADSEERPIKEDELKALCSEGARMPSEYMDWMRGTYTFAGIDWGFGLKSNSVLVIGQFNVDNPKLFDFVFMKKYTKKETDPKYCIPDMIELMRRYRVRRAHADWGGGFGLNSQIRDVMGEEFLTTNFWGPIKSKQVKFNVDLNAYMLNRTAHLARFFQALKRRQMAMRMCWQEFKPFAQDLLNVFREERKDGTMFFDHKPEEPDDSLHAMCYAWIIASLHKYGFEGVERVKGQEHFPYRA